MSNFNIRTASSGWVYPVDLRNKSNEYLYRQSLKLLASDLANDDEFGHSVSISSDGNTALIGAFRKSTSSAASSGAAYIFIRSGSTWTQQAKLLASDAASLEYFGYSVALSSDGNTALIGATSESTSPNSYNGAAYVFTRSGSTWIQQQKILASDAASNEGFGYSVALSSDGNTALIGANTESTSPNTFNGAAYVFTRSVSTWTQQQKLLASDLATSDNFGYSVALSSDGNTALIGAYGQSTSPTSDNGAAYVFTRSAGTWTQQQKLLASDAASVDYFGISVDLSSDGDTAIIGAYAEDTSYTNNGAAYVFTRSAGTWTQQQKLLASDAASSDVFGYSVALSSDGNTALIGATSESTSPSTTNGAAYVFTRSGTTWTQQQKILASDLATGDSFGYSVSISSDGTTAIIGAYQEDTSPEVTQGAAYIFEPTDWARVSAISVYNGGAWSVGYSPLPGAPTLTLSSVTNASGTTTTLSWTRPLSVFDITGYAVESSSNGISWTDLGFTGVTRSQVISFVPAGSVSVFFIKYYRVAAKTQYVTGPYSNIVAL